MAFKMLIIFLRYEIIYVSKFLSLNSVLLGRNKMCYWIAVKMLYKSSDFFLSESMKIWKSDILTISGFLESTMWDLLPDNIPCYISIAKYLYQHCITDSLIGIPGAISVYYLVLVNGAIVFASLILNQIIIFSLLTKEEGCKRLYPWPLRIQ